MIPLLSLYFQGRIWSFEFLVCDRLSWWFNDVCGARPNPRPFTNFTYDLEGIDSSNANDIISVIAMKCRSLKSITLYASFDSWESIHKVVECCRDLEEISLCDSSHLRLPLNISDFAAIASLSRLKSLELSYCDIDDGAVSPLAKCKGLRHLRGVNIKLSSDVLRAMGGNIKTLRCNLGLGGLEEIVEYCPNLENLILWLKTRARSWMMKRVCRQRY
jgi:hypothetical protein